MRSYATEWIKGHWMTDKLIQFDTYYQMQGCLESLIEFLVHYWIFFVFGGFVYTFIQVWWKSNIVSN